MKARQLRIVKKPTVTFVLLLVLVFPTNLVTAQTTISLTSPTSSFTLLTRQQDGSLICPNEVLTPPYTSIPVGMCEVGCAYLCFKSESCISFSYRSAPIVNNCQLFQNDGIEYNSVVGCKHYKVRLIN